MSLAQDYATLRVDGARLWDRLMTHAQVGARPDGGIDREALTLADRDGRDLFARWCGDLDLVAGVDELGTMFFTQPGQSSGDAIGLGSHLDTQPTGGKFDGILGVLAALEVIETLKAAEVPIPRDLTVVNWTSEEGSRFVPSMAASGAYAGVYPQSQIEGAQDVDGVTFLGALKDIGYRGSEPVGQRRFAAFLELHIEQGPLLEDANLPVGVVTGAQAMSFNTVTIRGREAHAGTTPMASRRDPMQAFAQIAGACFRAASDSAPEGRCTIGGIETKPHSHSSIPHEVTFFLDLRHPDQDGLNALLTVYEAEAEALRKTGFQIERHAFGTDPAFDFDKSLTDTLRAAATDQGVPHMDIVSGAGHDACFVAQTCPTAMLFCRCEGGISHNPAERITPEDATDAANVLLHATLRLMDQISEVET